MTETYTHKYMSFTLM